MIGQWRHGVVVITTAQLHSTNPELKFCADSNPARGVSEIRDGEDLWQGSCLEIRLNAFLRSTIPQKQFIIIIITIIIIMWKVFERLIYSSLFEYFIENDLSSPNQSGFKPGDSCPNQLISITIFWWWIWSQRCFSTYI